MVSNSSRHNGFVIGLPNQMTQDAYSQYSNLQDFANDVFGKIYGYNILEPFTEKIINGFSSTVGTISSGEQISTFALLIHNGQVYGFQYYDTPDKYYSVDSQKTKTRIILSFDILSNKSQITQPSDENYSNYFKTIIDKSVSLTRQYPG